MPDSLKALQSERKLTQADYASLAAFRHVLRRFNHFSIEAARQAGLTTQQHQALLVIKVAVGQGGGVITIGQLADQLLIAPHTAAELVARLDLAALVDKVEDNVDRRRVGLRLTDRAETALRQLTHVHLAEVRDLAPRLIALLAAFEAAAD